MKILLRQCQSPGDILMLTAAVRDLKRAHPYIEVNVETPAAALWDHNPLLDRSITAENADRVIHIGYPLINSADRLPYHFIHAFRKELALQLGLDIPQGEFRADLYLSDEEKEPSSLLDGIGPYWVVDAGYKSDFTLKNWGTSRYQQVVDILRGEVRFVQIGEAHPDHFHRELSGVVSLVGKTSLRDLIRVVNHAAGVLTPVSFPMHLCAALPLPDGGLRPCVVVAGGREPAHWEQYPGHAFFQNVGMFDCCRTQSCWRSRVEKLNDGQSADESICRHPVENTAGDKTGLCMAAIDPDSIAATIANFTNAGEITRNLAETI